MCICWSSDATRSSWWCWDTFSNDVSWLTLGTSYSSQFLSALAITVIVSSSNPNCLALAFQSELWRVGRCKLRGWCRTGRQLTTSHAVLIALVWKHDALIASVASWYASALIWLPATTWARWLCKIHSIALRSSSQLCPYSSLDEWPYLTATTTKSSLAAYF